MVAPPAAGREDPAGASGSTGGRGGRTRSPRLGISPGRLRRGMRRSLLVAIGILALSATAAPADSPTAALRGAVDAALKILEDPALKGDARVRERRLALSRVAEQAFDFPEIARRVLGRYWRERTAGEREEFTMLFRDLVERTYSSLLDRYGGEKVVYLDESVDGDFARVQTNVVTPRGTVVRVAYSMLQHDGRWLIVDISVENVSYVVNYRSQFNEIIQASSFPALLKRLRAKVEEFRRAESARARGRTE
ncbi:MAG: organic solvent tolerance ABC transporter substrate-binding protein [Candidatus Rokuibacteriota bacterium]|nr:MAG: organic solvent tolerance ABC transporter substrate-binding protein [Candidatus Rokubacteria bacterium]